MNLKNIGSLENLIIEMTGEIIEKEMKGNRTLIWPINEMK